MKINKIHLINYRIFNKRCLEFTKGVNVIYGDNAIGKTSVLEAIHILITTRSYRTNKLDEVISYNTSETIIKGEFEDEKTKKNTIVLISNKYKKFKFNEQVVAKSSDYVGFSSVVSFASTDIEGIVGAPSMRRKNLDIMISQIDKTYLELLKQYKIYIREKNAFLKEVGLIDKKAFVFLETINEKLYNLTVSIEKKRTEFVYRLNRFFEESHLFLSESKEKASLKLVKSFDEKGSFEEFVEKSKEDIRYKTGIIGPHRDNLEFKLNDKNIDRFGSQGQIKSMTLSLKAAYINMLKDLYNIKPIVLLDDVFGELDTKRQNKIMKMIDENIQVIITTPSLSEIDKDVLNKANIIKLEKEE